MLITREVIQEYLDKNKELKKINSQIEYYSKFVPVSEHGVVKGSMKDYPYAETHFVLSGSDIKSDQARQEKIKQLLITLCQKQKEYDEQTFAIEESIALMESDIGTIFFDKYVRGFTDRAIADELGYERSTITKKINQYFDEQDKIFTQIT